MIEAYFDESGTHKGALRSCVAGYVIESEQRVRMQADWDEVLDRYGLPYFHMSECAHGVGAFKNSNIDPKGRSEICRRLIELIKLRTEIGVVVSVSQLVFDSVASRILPVDAYSFCVNYCMNGVIAWARKAGYSGKISYFFEACHASQKVAQNIVNGFSQDKRIRAGLQYHSHSFVSEDSKRMCGLCAADLLSWEVCAAINNKYGPKRRAPRLSVLNLLNKTHIGMQMTPSMLTDYVAIGLARANGIVLDIPDSICRFHGTYEFENPLDALL